MLAKRSQRSIKEINVEKQKQKVRVMNEPISSTEIKEYRLWKNSNET